MMIILVCIFLLISTYIFLSSTIGTSKQKSEKPKPIPPSGQIYYSCAGAAGSGSCRQDRSCSENSTDGCFTDKTECEQSQKCKKPKPVTRNFKTMAWSGGDKFSSDSTYCVKQSFKASYADKYPFEICNAELVTLGISLPENFINTNENRALNPKDPKELSHIFEHISNDIYNTLQGGKTTYSTDTSRKYLLTVGGNGVQTSGWRLLTTYKIGIVAILKELYENYQIKGIDFDYEGQNDVTTFPSLIDIARQMKGLHDDYIVTFTISGNFNSTQPNISVAEQLKTNADIVDYVVLMMYGDTMWTPENSGGVSWGGLAKFGNLPKCSTQNNEFTSGSKTAIDMFENKIPLILAVTLFGDQQLGTYPCGNACLQAVYDLCSNPTNNVVGIAIWCFGSFAKECQCKKEYPDDNCAKLLVMNRIFDYFKNKSGSSLPTDEEITYVLQNKSALPWSNSGLDGYGCCLGTDTDYCPKG